MKIHRLPPAGQELFFTLLDKGLYRRLGETKDRKSAIMIIAATTEDRMVHSLLHSEEEYL